VLYGDPENNASHIAAISKIICHTLLIAPGSRWPADRVLQELDRASTGAEVGAVQWCDMYYFSLIISDI